MPRHRKEPLVTRDMLEKVVDGIEDLEPYSEYLKRRWVGMVMWWHNASLDARWKYFLLRGIVVAGGVLIPVLAALNMHPGWKLESSVATAVVGAIVAGCAAWEGVANYGEIWREKRRAAELLKVEGWQFLQLCGKYQEAGDYQKAYPHFAAEVECMIAKEVGEYLGAFVSSLVQVNLQASTIADTIDE